MNTLKRTLFSFSNKRKLPRSRASLRNNYEFRQASSSINNPLLYTFENANIELETIESDEESNFADVPNVRPRSIRPNLSTSAHDGGSIVIIEKPILPNETIQAFAIRNRVPVSQLKRLNNLQSDQDYYALTKCRVPVRRFGLLHECSESTSTLESLDAQTTLSLPVTHLSQQNHIAFLKAMDQDLALMRTKVEQLIETSSVTTAVTSSMYNITQSVPNSKNVLSCDDTDCNCRLWHIVIIVIAIALIPFILAYFYIKYYSKH